MGDHPGGPLRPARGEGGGRARRSQLVSGIGLSRPGRPSRCRCRSRRRRTGAPRRSGDSHPRSSRRRVRCWQLPHRRCGSDDAGADAPATVMAGLGRAGEAGGKRDDGKRGSELGLGVHVGSPFGFAGADMALMRIGRTGRGKVQSGGCDQRALCEKSQMGQCQPPADDLFAHNGDRPGFGPGLLSRPCQRRVEAEIYRGGAACCDTSCAEADALACTARIA